jgi:hypothetical protein
MSDLLRHRLLLGVLALASLTATREARANAETWELWTDLGVRVVPARRLRLTFTQSTRFSTIYGLRRIVPELEADYRVVGPLRLGLGYRYLWRQNAVGEVEDGHLVHGDAMVQLEWRRFDFELRSRVQWRSVNERNSGEPYDDTRNLWRNRINIEWNGPGPFGLNAFAEHWTRFDDSFRHDRVRVGAGASVAVAHWRFQLYYMRDMPAFIDNPNVNMVGVSARLNLDLVRR